ncbi:putative nucleolar protein 12 [Trichinella spiralis]|uniref:putative nucleolar protein 12 n=1 Tax=Trichinella spiralis TaxID=6334 RepID=UPI0001EFD0A9|nr:putative nucleolar protein 12 [Trichinella spiralis]
MEVSCLEDIEMEEYIDELENLAESLSDEDHVEEEGIFSQQCILIIKGYSYPPTLPK